jgi:hypothetical protein
MENSAKGAENLRKLLEHAIPRLVRKPGAKN